MKALIVLFPLLSFALYMYLFIKNAKAMPGTISQTATHWTGKHKRFGQFYFILCMIAVGFPLLLINDSWQFILAAVGLMMYVGIAPVNLGKATATIHTVASVVTIVWAMVCFGLVYDSWIPLVSLVAVWVVLAVSKPRNSTAILEAFALIAFYFYLAYFQVF